VRREDRTGGATNSSCPTGKLAYTKRAEAREHARRLKRSRSHDGAGVRPYVCPSCGFWHVGHLPPEVMRGELTADEHYLGPPPWLRRTS
jgi:predicted RNA-binding Zn-ribbon protein involved in translation (DUF1610 family)